MRSYQWSESQSRPFSSESLFPWPRQRGEKVPSLVVLLSHSAVSSLRLWWLPSVPGPVPRHLRLHPPHSHRPQSHSHSHRPAHPGGRGSASAHSCSSSSIARHLRLHASHRRRRRYGRVPASTSVARHLRLLLLLLIPRLLGLQETPLLITSILRHDAFLLSVVDERAAELRGAQWGRVGCDGSRTGRASSESQEVWLFEGKRNAG